MIEIDPIDLEELITDCWFSLLLQESREEDKDNIMAQQSKNNHNFFIQGRTSSLLELYSKDEEVQQQISAKSQEAAWKKLPPRIQESLSNKSKRKDELTGISGYMWYSRLVDLK
jgi:hypothetical protein